MNPKLSFCTWLFKDQIDLVHAKFGVSVKTHKCLEKLTHYTFELKMFILSNGFQNFKNAMDDVFKDNCGNISFSNF
jgi:hypothetical protein